MNYDKKLKELKEFQLISIRRTIEVLNGISMLKLTVTVLAIVQVVTVILAVAALLWIKCA